MTNVMYCYEVVYKRGHSRTLSREIYKTLKECVKVIESRHDKPQRVAKHVSTMQYESDLYIYIIYEMNVKG